MQVETLRCETVSIQLAGVADGEASLSRQAADHVEGCIRCQAELAQYRKLLRALNGLRGQTMFVDETMLDDVLTALRPVAPVHRLRRRNYRTKKVAYVAGAAAAAAAGAAAGVFVLATRVTAESPRLAS